MIDFDLLGLSVMVVLPWLQAASEGGHFSVAIPGLSVHSAVGIPCKGLRKCAWEAAGARNGADFTRAGGALPALSDPHERHLVPKS
jgi:hypothetical protein